MVGVGLTFINVITGAILCRSISQDALRCAPHSGVAGLYSTSSSSNTCTSSTSSTSWNSWQKGVWKASRGVLVNLVRQGEEVRPVRLVVQAPGETQVTSVLVHAAHVSSARIWQDTAFIHIYTLSRPAVICKTFCAGLSMSRLDTKQNKYQSCQHPRRRAKPEATYFQKHGFTLSRELPGKRKGLDPFAATPQNYAPFYARADTRFSLTAVWSSWSFGT